MCAGVRIEAPLVDGLCGTVFAMTTAIQALVDTLPPERKARPTVAILGGGGYIGARLVTVLASKQASAAGTDKQQKLNDAVQGPVLLDQSPHSSDDDLSDDTTASHDQDIATATVTLRDRGAERLQAYKQVIALDLRYEGNRHEEAGVLYTADPRDLSAADVVLVITRNGDNVADYVDYARPGQVGMPGQRLCALAAGEVSSHVVSTAALRISCNGPGSLLQLQHSFGAHTLCCLR